MMNKINTYPLLGLLQELQPVEGVQASDEDALWAPPFGDFWNRVPDQELVVGIVYFS